VNHRVIVVSNRLPELDPSKRRGAPEIPAGGLASAVFGALSGTSGNLWIGWSGRVGPAQRVTETEIGGIRLIGVSLDRHDVDHFYNGFCNSVIWPLFHCFPGRVQVDLEQAKSYVEVQTKYAEAVRRHLRPGDALWINDYHLLLMGRTLRRGGWRGPTGFFLHIPFPPHELFSVLPGPREFLDAMLDYDVVGFHTPSYLENYVSCCRRELGATWNRGVLRHGDRSQRVGVYPVGIDPADFLPDRALEEAPTASPRTQRRPSSLKRFSGGRKLVLGVDRLDYTKGIPERILGFTEFIRRNPEWVNRVSLVQIASPSRTRVRSYSEHKKLIDELVGRVNGELSEHDWIPVRYLYRSYARDVLANFYREADVGLVTPLRDGMNLVAKEFLASQRPENPGVLVLSRFAGAAEELEEAVMVNPYISSDLAAGVGRALTMPLEERRQRHEALLDRILRPEPHDWARRFLEDLGRAERGLIPEPAGAAGPHRAR